jgi:hypothetical protein
MHGFRRVAFLGGGVSRVWTGLLFWLLVICAVGFARYLFLAMRSGDVRLAVAAAIAFLLVCAAAVMQLKGMLP